MYGLKEYKNVLVFVIYLEPWEEGIINIIICCKIHHYTCSTSPLNIPSSFTFFLLGKIHYQLSKCLGFVHRSSTLTPYISFSIVFNRTTVKPTDTGFFLMDRAIIDT